MELYAIDKSDLTTFTIDGDTTGAKFFLGPLTPFEVAFIQTLASNPEEHFFFSMKVIAFGLKGWEGFKNRKGELVPFKTSTLNIPVIGDVAVAANESINMIPQMAIVKMSNTILESNMLVDNQKKS